MSAVTRAPLVTLALVAACRDPSPSPDVGKADAGAPAKPPPIVASPTYPAVDPPVPSLVHVGGRFLKHPRIVTVTWKNDEPRVVEKLEAFGGWVLKSSWWSAVTKDLCVRGGDCMGGAGDVASVRLDEAAPAKTTIAELGERMTALVDKGALPRPDDDRLYLVYLPRGTTITGVADACAPHGTRAVHTTFGWPKTAEAASRPVSFVLRCSDELGELTGTASHEVLETASDPTLDGFQLDRAPRFQPFSLFGIEAVDLCNLVTLEDHRASVDGWTVHRAWSSTEARAGRDPCVPHRPNDPYFAVVPKESVVVVPRDKRSAVVPLTGIAERAVPAWSVAAFELAALRGKPTCLSLELDRRDANNGTPVTLTVSLAGPPCRDAAAIMVVSTLGTRSHAWPLLVEVK
jgi:hypothetical protein